MKSLLTALILFVSLTASAGTPADSTSIPFGKNANVCSLITVKVTLNGIDCYLMIDCGSELSVLNSSVASTFQFQNIADDDNKNMDWSGGSVNVSRASHATVMLGTIVLKNAFKSANLDALLSTIAIRTGRNVIGIIGADILDKYHLVVDYSTRTIHH